MIIAIPETEGSLAKGIGEAHKRYSRLFQEGWLGYLFQGRFSSCPLEGEHIIAAILYVLRNPVRSGIVKKPWSYRWPASPRSRRKSTTGKLFSLMTLSKTICFAYTPGPGDLLEASRS